MRALWRRMQFLAALSQAQHIGRRYFVTNGFDGALAQLGPCMGFFVSGDVRLGTVINACIGAGVALGVSGVSSTDVSEAAERRRELQDLEAAMVASLEASAHARASRYLPVMVALVSGAAPLLVSLCILLPLWAAAAGLPLPLRPLEAAILAAFAVIFLLGAFLGRIAGTFWLWMALRTLVIALVTALVVFWVGHR